MLNGRKNWKNVLPANRSADEKLWTGNARLFSLSNVPDLKCRALTLYVRSEAFPMIPVRAGMRSRLMKVRYEKSS